MHESTFSLVPLEVIKDKRLTLWQVRVLVALFSFRNRDTNTVWPSRNAIAERSGMHPSNISTTTTELVGLGWLSKEGMGGFSKSSRYTITTPDLETVADSTTVAEPTTVADSATRMRIAAPATRKEQTIEQTKGESARKLAPIPPQARKASKLLTSLPDWMAQVAATGEKAIPDTDPVRSYAAQAGIPADFLVLAWVEFKVRYSEPDAKRYRDWRQVFRNTVRGNWLKLWFINQDGHYQLTTAGQQARNILETGE